jgi:glutamate 5-kinase
LTEEARPLEVEHARRLVIKAGSSLLACGDDGAAAHDFTRRVAGDVARLRAGGAEVILVSSGAVALGRPRLGLPARARLSLDEKQAAAAAGQGALMAAWGEALAPHGLAAAQVLLTRDDTETRRRWLNARATVDTLLRLGAVPVVNENDTVATEELRYGDNDRLAARVAQMARADLLVLLSDVDGLYTADPRRDPAARHLPGVLALTPEVLAMAGGPNAEAGVGAGGMASKLAAAAIAREAGCDTLIASGRAGGEAGGPLLALETGAARATRIHAGMSPRAAYKGWIAGGLDLRGALRVDAGAVRALRAGGSLLSAGVTAVDGGFGRGDAVRVLGPDGAELARGLVRVDATTARAAAGRRSRDADGLDGRPELIHRDDLVVLTPAPPGAAAEETAA